MPQADIIKGTGSGQDYNPVHTQRSSVSSFPLTMAILANESQPGEAQHWLTDNENGHSHMHTWLMILDRSLLPSPIGSALPVCLLDNTECS